MPVGYCALRGLNPCCYTNALNTFCASVSMCAATLLEPIFNELGCPHALRSFKQPSSSCFVFFPMTEMVSRICRKSNSFRRLRSSVVIAIFHFGSLLRHSALNAAKCLMIISLYRTETAPTHERTTALDSERIQHKQSPLQESWKFFGL